jgi:hypothetical protein
VQALANDFAAAVQDVPDSSVEQTADSNQRRPVRVRSMAREDDPPTTSQRHVAMRRTSIYVYTYLRTGINQAICDTLCKGIVHQTP